MADNLFWFYDAFVAGVLLIAIFCGSKRGFLRSAVLIALMAASFVGSWLLASVGSPVIYEKALQKPILTALNDASEKTNPLSVVAGAMTSGGYGVEMTDPEIEGVISQSGDFFTNIASEIKNNGAGDSEQSIQSGMEQSVTDKMLTALIGDVVSPETLKEVLAQVEGTENNLRQAVDVFLHGDRTRTAESVENKLIAPAAKMLLKGIIWVVSMFILTIAAKFIAGMFQSINKVPIIGPVNVLAGGLLGLAEGLIIVYIAAQVVRFICYMSGDSLMFLNRAAVAKTYVFKYIFDLDIMSLI